MKYIRLFFMCSFMVFSSLLIGMALDKKPDDLQRREERRVAVDPYRKILSAATFGIILIAMLNIGEHSDRCKSKHHEQQAQARKICWMQFEQNQHKTQGSS